jgi:PPOX class probable F420-dependent enzyme
VAASKLAELPSWAAELLNTSRVARLGLLDDEGRPRVLPITFAIAADRIWTAVDDKPKRKPARELARMRFLRRDPRATITVDRYAENWKELAWVQVLGSIRIVELDETDQAAPGLASLVEKYAPYRDSPPPGPLLALEPARCLCWRASDGGS